MNLTFKVVDFDSKEQKATIELRDKILRKPLDMQFTAEQLAAEKDDIHLATYLDGELVACLVLMHYTDSHLKMRQVAVDDTQQRKGIGQLMVLESERIGKAKGYQYMFCHARDVAAPFYKKLDYYILGDSFEEVGIKHWKMEKVL